MFTESSDIQALNQFSILCFSALCANSLVTGHPDEGQRKYDERAMHMKNIQGECQARL